MTAAISGADTGHSTMSEEAELDKIQVERMKWLSVELDRLGVKYGLRSMASGNAVFHRPFSYLDAVRPGIMLYGASPFADTSAQQLGLQPVMTLTSEIISVREMKAGDGVGYAGLFRADKTMRIGTVACGYADGYPRHAPSGTPILVNGQRTRTLGPQF